MRRQLLILLTSQLALISPAIASSFDVPRAKSAIDVEINKRTATLDALYRDIHQHPELSLQEVRTAGVLAREMRELGLEVTEGIGGTGVVALLRNGTGPTVLIRTELDALPMEEKSGATYASAVQVPYKGGTTFVAHSCGHDVHMAWWIGTAEALIALKSQWRGTVEFVAQPGEEAGGGAAKMIADGLFRRFPKPDFGFAAHVGNDPVGTVDVKEGAVTSNSDTIQIVFNGRGAHGSMPNESIDPIVMGAHFVSDVQTIISREKDAFEFGVVTVGSFQAGSAANIIPDKARLALTLRSFTPQVRAKLVEGVERTARAVAEMAAAPAPQIDHLAGSNSVINDIGLARQIGAVLRDAGADTINEEPASAPGSSASENYSDLVVASGMRSVYFGIGGYDRDIIAQYRKTAIQVPTNHSPDFLPDHAKAIRTGVRTLTLSALSVLAVPTPNP